MIKGDNVYLRLTEKYDLNIIMDMYKTTSKDKITFSRHKKYIYENFTKISNSPLTCLSVINEKNVLVGFVTYINKGNDCYKIGITIGLRFRNRGYGKEVISLLVDHLFITHNCKNVSLEVEMDNEIAISCYKSCGFTINSDAKINGIREDIMYMEITNENYKKKACIA